VTQHGRSYNDAPRLPEGNALDPRALLGSAEPIELELGPGSGAFLMERLADPSAHILGLEIRLKSAALLDEKIHQHKEQHRARCFAEDARHALPRLVPESVSRIYLHFPDPWWKKRHQKRILLQPQLCDEAARLLRPGGELFVQTDVMERADYYESVLLGHPSFEPLGPSPRAPDPNFGARSSRERRAMADGLPIVRLRFVRVR
jgi:tRNA (guanine-N7-)-methyltransferase